MNNDGKLDEGEISTAYKRLCEKHIDGATAATCESSNFGDYGQYRYFYRQYTDDYDTWSKSQYEKMRQDIRDGKILP